MILKGLNGQIELTESTVVIKRKGFLAVASKGFAGEKSIPLTAITSIQFKTASFWSGNGFIKFCFGGAVEKQGNLKEAVRDENAVIFRSKSNKFFEELKNEIERSRIWPGQNRTTISITDEIEKLAGLKEKGYISEQEYNDKKVNLLSKL